MSSHLLFYIPAPWDWTTEQVANIISLVAATATVAALWYAFYRNRQQDKKINDLAEITTKLAEQNELQSKAMRASVRPDIIQDGVTQTQDGALTFAIKNYGERAIIISIIDKENDFDYKEMKLPIILRKGAEHFIFSQLKDGKHIEQSKYYIVVEFQDVYTNGYQVILSGDGVKRNKAIYKDL